ncbi:rod shape-determining protein [Escherichia coli]|uniref:Rod shape-determining protein n=1 Tax=Escherichia coli TaxID=562 RepID=A0A377BYR2_ECOLX|nr:rod shape-determining protein [Escherichia coli]
MLLVNCWMAYRRRWPRVDQLELENRALRQELLLKNSELLMLGQYKQENARLRELLGSPLRQDEQKMVTQVISTVNDPYSDQVVIDKGSVNGVYEGQPVISDKGVVVRWWPSLN